VKDNTKNDLQVVDSYLSMIAKQQQLSQDQATIKIVIRALLELAERTDKLDGDVK
jgi:hypothetical protein